MKRQYLGSILVVVYARQARSEEHEVAQRFGEHWTADAARTPAFTPRLPAAFGERVRRWR